MEELELDILKMIGKSEEVEEVEDTNKDYIDPFFESIYEEANEFKQQIKMDDPVKDAVR